MEILSLLQAGSFLESLQSDEYFLSTKKSFVRIVIAVCRKNQGKRVDGRSQFWYHTQSLLERWQSLVECT